MKIVSIYDFFQKFPDEEAARLYLEKKRWNGSIVCPHCRSHKVSECKSHKPMPYRCKECRKHFSVRTGTVLEESRLPLKKWLLAIYMMTSSRKGIPSTQMAKELGITQKSAWFLAQRIREAWLNKQNEESSDSDKLDGEVEVDETFIGGKESNKHSKKKLRQGRDSVGKAVVIGIKQRNGDIVVKHAPDVTAKTLHGFIEDNVVVGATVYTDDFKSYRGLNKYNHLSVNHSVGEYVNQKAYTNGIESFWALLKRGYYGIYHFMSSKHLERYIQEFAFRNNTASWETMNFIDRTFEMMYGKHISYKQLTN